jgi:hypothetical protein
MDARGGDGALLVQRADDHVVEHRKPGERLHQLESAADACGADLVRTKALDRLSIEKNLARIRREHPGDHVEDRGLARAVGPDQPVDAALRHLERGLAHGLQSAE